MMINFIIPVFQIKEGEKILLVEEIRITFQQVKKQELILFKYL